MSRLLKHMKLPRVAVDWRAVWERFKEAHGDPVPYKGRLLFPDGWTHAAADLRGPEFPPPWCKSCEFGDDGKVSQPCPTCEAEIDKLKLHYWLIRRKAVEAEVAHFIRIIAHARELKQSRSVPVEPYVATFDGESKTWKRTPFEPEAWEAGRLQMLKDDLKDCTNIIEELKAPRSHIGDEHGKVAETAAQR